MFIDLHTNLVKNLCNSIENNILHISHSAKQHINKNIFQLLYLCEHFTFFSCDCLYLFTMSNKTVENSRVLNNNWWRKHVTEVLKLIKQHTMCIFSMSCYLWTDGIDFLSKNYKSLEKNIVHLSGWSKECDLDFIKRTHTNFDYGFTYCKKRQI